MNKAIKTYGVVVNLDYAHHSSRECEIIWHKLSQYMLKEDFHIDKRMFLITTVQSRDVISDKARHALSELDQHLGIFNKYALQYISDFFIVEMSDYVDLRLPASDIGLELREYPYRQNDLKACWH